MQNEKSSSLHEYTWPYKLYVGDGFVEANERYVERSWAYWQDEIENRSSAVA